MAHRGHSIKPQENTVDGTFGILVRLFFSRFFDKESLSPQGDPEANVIQTLGILAAPGGLISLLLYFNAQAAIGWNLVTVRCLFLYVSMVVIGFIVVFEWDALFLDLRDYQILLPLPLPLWKLLAAKMTAFVVFLGMFLAAINGIVTLLWSSVLDNGNFLLVTGAHLLMVAAAGVFAAFAAASIQGLLLITVPAKIFRPVATGVQTLLMSTLVMLFFLSPLFAGGIQLSVVRYPAFARFIPAFWFVGLYERLRPATGNAGLLTIGQLALSGLSYAVALFGLTHLPLYKRHVRKLIEAPPSNPSGPGRIHRALNAVVDRLLLKNPIQQAVYNYIGQTISRSMKHRLFLAVYGGFGMALVIFSLSPSFDALAHGLSTGLLNPGVLNPGIDRGELLRVPLTLSFVLVSGLRAAFNFPAELTANWAFQMSDTNQTRQCLIAMRKWTIVCGVIPLFLLLLPLQLFFFSWQMALFQFLYGVALSIVLVEVMFFDFRKIPFTCGYFPERNNLVWLIAIYVGGLVLYSSKMADLEIWLMWEHVYAAAFLPAVALVWLAFWQWHGRAKSQASLDYLGDEDPVIRTLGLSH